MTDKFSEDIEIAPPSVVMQAANDFAAALAETPQFKAFEQAAWNLKYSPEAEKAKNEFLAKQNLIRAQYKLKSVPPEAQKELERLRMAYLDLDQVSSYQEAEASLRELCQVLSGQLSRQIGLDFAAVSSPGCC